MVLLTMSINTDKYSPVTLNSVRLITETTIGYLIHNFLSKIEPKQIYYWILCIIQQFHVLAQEVKHTDICLMKLYTNKWSNSVLLQLSMTQTIMFGLVLV